MDFTGINFKDLTWPAAAALLFIYLMIKEARLFYTSFTDRKWRKKHGDEGEGLLNKKTAEKLIENQESRGKYVEEIHQTIKEFLSVRDVVIRSGQMLEEIKNRLDVMETQQTRLFEIITVHESRISKIEGMEQARE